MLQAPIHALVDIDPCQMFDLGFFGRFVFHQGQCGINILNLIHPNDRIRLLQTIHEIHRQIPSQKTCRIRNRRCDHQHLGKRRQKI